MKKIFLAMIALSVTIAVFAQNQEREFQLGDTVYVPHSAEYFLTGEHIAPWVYDEPQVITIIGGKRFPEGVLLQPVNSWFTKESLLWAPDTDNKQITENKEQVTENRKQITENRKQETVVEQPKPQPVVEKPQPKAEVEKSTPVVETQPEPVVEEVISTGRPAEHRFGIGARGGVASLCQQMNERVVNGKRHLGGEGAIDLEYTYLSQTLNSGLCQLGVKTGVSLAFGSNSITAEKVTATYSTKDQNSRDLLYTNSAKNIKEHHYQLMVEVPLMFALRGTKGFSFAIGPKFNLPVAGWYNQTYTNPVIDCQFVKEDVHEINEVVTGRLDGVAPANDNKLRTALFNLMIASEIGYEWQLKNGNGLGLLAYGGYYLLSSYEPNSNPVQSFIYVDGPKAGGPTITGNAVMNDCGTGMGYLSGGIKLVYNFSFKAK